MLKPLEQSPSENLAGPNIGRAARANNDGAVSAAVLELRRIGTASGEQPSYRPPGYATRSGEAPWSCQWRALSIFSGCGGLDLGFIQEGIHPVSAYDQDRKAIKAYNTNILGIGRVADLSIADPAKERADVLLAGAPCQGFSTSGKRELADPRNALLMRVADIAITHKPKVVIIENVPAALSGAHHQIWSELECRLKFSGYNVRRVLIDGSKTGLAQRRKRLFLVCWVGSDCIQIKLPTENGLNIGQALAGIEYTQGHEIVLPVTGGRHWKIASRIPPGHKLSNVRTSDRSVPTWAIPEVFGRVSESEIAVLRAVARLRRRDRVRSFGDGDPVSSTALANYLDRDVLSDLSALVAKEYLRNMGGLFELQHTYNGRYRRLSWQELAPTVDTKFGRIELFIHPDEIRGMTAREAARLQGFPDSYLLTGARCDQFIQIGNAVPPPMAAQLAEFVREALLKA